MGGYSDLKGEEPRTGVAAHTPSAKQPKGIHWDEKGENNLPGSYGKGSSATLKRKRKAAKELEMEASESYDIGALWQRNRDLGLFPQANTQPDHGEDSQLGPGNVENGLYSLPKSHPVVLLNPKRNP